MWCKCSRVKLSREILELLNASTAKEQSIVEKFRSRGRAQVQEFCDHGTKEDCVRSGDTPQPCTKLHFRSGVLKVLKPTNPIFCVTHRDANVHLCNTQSHHQQTHWRESRRLLLPQHLFPYGHLQICPLWDWQPPRGREQPAGAPVRVRGAGTAGGRRRQQRGETVPLAGGREAGTRVRARGDGDGDGCFYSAVDLLRHQILGRVHPGEVRRGDGRPTLGHPHGAALRNADWRRDEKIEHPHFARWRIHLPLGYWKVAAGLDQRPAHCWTLQPMLSLFSGLIGLLLNFYSDRAMELGRECLSLWG